jgi:hypothetical protein
MKDILIIRVNTNKYTKVDEDTFADKLERKFKDLYTVVFVIEETKSGKMEFEILKY